jgi:hypothetical protein
VTDVVALTHIYNGVRTLNGHEKDMKVTAQPGGLTRVRVVNTDNGPTSTWVTVMPPDGAAVRIQVGGSLSASWSPTMTWSG